MRAPRPLGLACAFAGAALVATFSGCVSSRAHRGSGNPFSQEPADRKEIRIRVVNLNFNDATVWALVHDARRSRLGIVNGKSEATFTMLWTFQDALRLEFDLLAGVRCVTEPLPVDPGEVIELQISADPGQDPGCR